MTFSPIPARRRPAALAAGALMVGLGLGALGGHGIAGIAPPNKHAGLTVQKLGVVSEESLKATVGLEGHFLQLRAITVAPGGQIAAHSHAKRPGLVKVIGGAWVEGRPDGEATFTADDATAIVEDENTEHWIWNRGDAPATAIVCDLNPTG